jgi:hypothetical protein
VRLARFIGFSNLQVGEGFHKIVLL